MHFFDCVFSLHFFLALGEVENESGMDLHIVEHLRKILN